MVVDSFPSFPVNTLIGCRELIINDFQDMKLSVLLPLLERMSRALRLASVSVQTTLSFATSASTAVVDSFCCVRSLRLMVSRVS